MVVSRIHIAILIAALAGVPACNCLPHGPAPAGEAGSACEPACARDHTLEAIACDIDHVEKHIDAWGSITTKHPDVWGAARLTRYQQDVERIFALEVNPDKIDEKVNAFQAARSRSDQAFLAQAVAINAALTGQQAALLPPDPITVVTGTRQTFANDVTQGVFRNKNVATTAGNLDGATTTVDRVTGPDLTRNTKTGTEEGRTATTAPPPAVPIPEGAAIPSDLTTYSQTATNVNRNPATLAPMPGFGDGGLRLEPSVVLDEKKRFLDHLNQIRRINEGDDTADSPGYALYLVRVPVSVLPGKRTDTGHGAEITMSVKPIIGDELLPSTFRNLVINDLVDQFSEMLTALLSADRQDLLTNFGPAAVAAAAPPPPDCGFSALLRWLGLRSTHATHGDEFTPGQRAAVRAAVARARPKYTSPRPSRHAEYAFPMSHVDEIMGGTFVKALVVAAVGRYERELKAGQVVHLHDVRAVVREQVVAGYRFLTAANTHAWSLCTQDLARAVRDVNGNTHGTPTVRQYQVDYDRSLGRETGKDHMSDSARLVVKALGWAILVESALLTEQLVRDMKETAAHKGCCAASEAWQDYFHPEPSAEARRAFNEYVTCRWPVHTFAVDPVVEQQNVQDTLSQRREMQLALSLAFASGNISASSFTRYARRLEADYQTIDLNRTVVGFSHGDNTFGWRFYPRFQPPEIPGTLKVVGRDLIAGRAFTRNQELRNRRLEPGQRECVALVVMPSFVPYAEVNVSSSWFNLADPKHKSHSTQEALQLSRRLHAIETCSPQGDQERYQAGLFARLQAKAQMLSARLPLQDMRFQVPYENTLGGFEFFNSGITDLAPQLRGWYGAAGYNGTATELFLMGDNFSVTGTKVVAGGRLAAHELLSRQVVRVVIPADAIVGEDTPGQYSEGGKFVDVHLATPYGVSGSLRVPVLGPAPSPPQPPALAPLIDGQVVLLDRDTTLVLVGSNFTADTRVVAGGLDCAVEVVGPTVVRVTVPKGAATRTVDKGIYVEVKAATGGGASNAIQVPVGAPPAAAPGAAASFTAPTLAVAFRYKNIGIEGVGEPNRRPTGLAISVPDGLAGDADVEFKSDAGTVLVPGVRYNSATKRLENFSAAFTDKLIATFASRYGPENVNPPVPLKFTARIKPKEGPQIKVGDGLTVTWVRVPDEKK